MNETTASAPLCFVGDWHGDVQWSVRALRAAARAGAKVLVSVGDASLDWPGKNRTKYEKRVDRILAEHGMTLVVSPGNHDNLTNINKLEVQNDGLITWFSNIKVLPKGGRTEIARLRIAGLGGAASADQDSRTEGKNWWPDEEPTPEQAERLIALGPVDVLVTHDAPEGVPVQAKFHDLPSDILEKADRTRRLLRDTVDALVPAHVFCGHWHQRVTHELVHPDGRISRVDVLGMQGDRFGNAVLVWPGETPLRIEPLYI